MTTRRDAALIPPAEIKRTLRTGNLHTTVEMLHHNFRQRSPQRRKRDLEILRICFGTISAAVPEMDEYFRSVFKRFKEEA